MTYDQEIGEDATEVFRFFRQSYKKPQLKHLQIAPFDLRNFLRRKIEQEIENHRAGKPSGISIKVNNFSDTETNELMRRASDAGVPVRMIVRSMFSLVIEEGSSLEAISIVDKYLEHSRMLLFENGGEPEVFLSSADFMPRNFDTRVESIFPIYEKKLRNQLIGYFNIQWSDNVKARILDKNLTNQYRPNEGGKAMRAQFEIEKYLRDKN